MRNESASLLTSQIASSCIRVFTHVRIDALMSAEVHCSASEKEEDKQFFSSLFRLSSVMNAPKLKVTVGTWITSAARTARSALAVNVMSCARVNRSV